MLRVSADVQADEPIDMIERVWMALTGPSLENFLRDHAHGHFERDIVNRFAYEGDSKSGNWPALSEATVQIRESAGVTGDWPVNIRTEEMFQTVTEEADFFQSENAAEMMLPGSAGASGTVAEKIRTAQQGKPAPNPMSSNFGPTPPRPVLAADESDLAALVEMLERYIIWEIVRGFQG